MGQVDIGANYKRRRVTLTDNYDRSISVKLWNQHAENMDLDLGIIIRAERMEVDEWNSYKSLNSTNNTLIKVS